MKQWQESWPHFLAKRRCWLNVTGLYGFLTSGGAKCFKSEACPQFMREAGHGHPVSWTFSIKQTTINGLDHSGRKRGQLPISKFFLSLLVIMSSSRLLY
jgi:hypothetical protein